MSLNKGKILLELFVIVGETKHLKKKYLGEIVLAKYATIKCKVFQ